MSKSIKLKNNYFWDSSAIMHRRQNLKTYLDSKDNKSIVQMWISTTNYLTNELTWLSWDNAIVKGTKLQFDSTNHRVKVVDPTVKHVKITAQIFMEDFNGDHIGYVWAFIRQNDTSIYNTIFSGARVYFQTILMNEYVFDVNIGDYFDIMLNNPNYETWHPPIRAGKYNTRFTVEAID